MCETVLVELRAAASIHGDMGNPIIETTLYGSWFVESIKFAFAKDDFYASGSFDNRD